MPARQLQVGQKLCFVNGQNLLNCFQLEYDFLLNDQIDLVPTIELNAFVRNGEVDLPLKRQAAQVQLMT